MESIDTKDIVKKTITRTSNEEILDAVKSLTENIATIKADIAELKIKTGANDKPVMPPQKMNYNNDGGPFGAVAV